MCFISSNTMKWGEKAISYTGISYHKSKANDKMYIVNPKTTTKRKKLKKKKKKIRKI